MKKVSTLLLIIILSVNLFSQGRKLPEFRGVWISTVKMLDYPSGRYLSSGRLKQEYIKIVDSCQAIGINAIIFQVRPAADAFYASPYEPWSEWLSGKQGQAPEPYFDPLEFMINETHLRGMEFHAWINPYRAIATVGRAGIASNHITRTKPQWFFDYGVNRYFNPGIPEVRQYIVDIVADIVKRYDIDGIHFDDYFYPYPLRNEANKIIPIPDFSTYKKYGNSFSNIKNWRRNNINLLIEEVHNTVKSIKPEVRFGVSPPAVWRNKQYDPNGSATLGLAAYDWIYADALTWIDHNWIDYIAPQLYWHIGHQRADYKILLDWWIKNCKNTDLYIGLNIHGIDASRKKKHWGNPNQIPRQIRLAEKYSAVKGFALFRYKSLSMNPLGIKDSLRNNYFKPVIIPTTIPSDTLITDTTDIVIPVDTTTIADTSQLIVVSDNKISDTLILKPPENIEKYRVGREITIAWDDPNPHSSDTTIHYVVYVLESKIIPEKIPSANKFETVNQNFVRFERTRKWKIFGKKYTFVITASDNKGNESKPSKPILIKL